MGIARSRIENIKTRVDLEGLLDRSRKSPVFLLKHSSMCSISASVLSAYEEFVQGQGTHRPWIYGLIRVIEESSLSDQLSAYVGVQHASPQLLLIKDFKVIWHDSHWRLTLQKMKEVVNQFLQASQREGII